MSAFPWGSLVAAGSNLLGGLFGSEGNRKANENARDLAREQIQLQKDFAQQGLRWRVADAKAAGIHPLAALGANTVSFSPISVGGTADTALGSAVANMGQDLGRAINATRTAPERDQAYRTAAAEIALAQGEAQIGLLRAQTAATLKQSVTSPPFPGATYLLDGQAQTPVLERGSMVKSEPHERNPVDPRRNYQEPVTRSDRTYLRLPSGKLMAAPSEEAKKVIEDILPHEIAHYFRNNIMPEGEPYKAKKGYQWHTPIWGFGTFNEIKTRRDAREMLHRFKYGW